MFLVGIEYLIYMVQAINSKALRFVGNLLERWGEPWLVCVIDEDKSVGRLSTVSWPDIYVH